VGLDGLQSFEGEQLALHRLRVKLSELRIMRDEVDLLVDFVQDLTERMQVVFCGQPGTYAF
jgi:hypothetical protein